MSAENTAFSSSGEEVITRTIDVEVDNTADNLNSSAEFDAFYEIEQTATEIEQADYKRASSGALFRHKTTDYLSARWLYNSRMNCFMIQYKYSEG